MCTWQYIWPKYCMHFYNAYYLLFARILNKKLPHIRCLYRRRKCRIWLASLPYFYQQSRNCCCCCHRNSCCCWNSSCSCCGVSWLISNRLGKLQSAAKLWRSSYFLFQFFSSGMHLFVDFVIMWEKTYWKRVEMWTLEVSKGNWETDAERGKDFKEKKGRFIPFLYWEKYREIKQE